MLNGKGKEHKDMKNLDKKDIITDDDKNHKKWRVKPSEIFTKVFYFNQKKYPKNKDGKLLCVCWASNDDDDKLDF